MVWGLQKQRGFVMPPLLSEPTSTHHRYPAPPRVPLPVPLLPPVGGVVAVPSAPVDAGGRGGGGASPSACNPRLLAGWGEAVPHPLHKGS